jgi:hypothetical protein
MKSSYNAAVAEAQWVKRGVIFAPPQGASWLNSHAAIPFVMQRDDGRFRAYFAGRDGHNRSQTGYFDFNIEDPKGTLRICDHPVLRHGDLGTFDETGAMISWIVNHDGRLYMFYSGWNQGTTVPFRTAIGLAVSNDGGETFERYGRGPILDRGIHDACLTASPCVLIEHGLWRMWYVSCVKWEMVNGKPRHYYHVQYAESDNGIEWRRDGRVCIGFKSGEEYAIARPVVRKENGIYRMWYSYRGDSYRIGYAESADGLEWERLDDTAGIDVSSSGWDSEMVEYPFVFSHRGQHYMLYNGNGFGRTGIGLAVLSR